VGVLRAVVEDEDEVLAGAGGSGAHGVAFGGWEQRGLGLLWVLVVFPNYNI
jgi:hypothetical protein